MCMRTFKYKPHYMSGFWRMHDCQLNSRYNNFQVDWLVNICAQKRFSWVSVSELTSLKVLYLASLNCWKSLKGFYKKYKDQKRKVRVNTWSHNSRLKIRCHICSYASTIHLNESKITQLRQSKKWNIMKNNVKNVAELLPLSGGWDGAEAGQQTQHPKVPGSIPSQFHMS